MRKWIILAVLAVLLIVGIILANQLMNKGNDEGQALDTTPEETYSEKFLELLGDMTWEEFNALSEEEKYEIRETFREAGEFKTFIQWENKGKAEYEAKQDVTIVGPNQSIDVGEIVGTEK